jgi:hypothetical protein
MIKRVGKSAVPKALIGLGLVWMGGVMEDMIRGRYGGFDDEDWKEKWAKGIAITTATYPFMGVIGLRDAVGYAAQEIKYGRMFGTNPILDQIQESIRAGVDVSKMAVGAKDKLSKSEKRDLIMTIGAATRTPSVEVWNWYKYFAD